MKTKPTQETGLSEEGIGEAIKEGAITKQYLADPKTIVSALNGGRKSHARAPTSRGLQRTHSRDWRQGSSHTTNVTRYPENDGAACQRASRLLETLKRDPWVDVTLVGKSMNA